MKSATRDSGGGGGDISTRAVLLGSCSTFVMADQQRPHFGKQGTLFIGRGWGGWGGADHDDIGTQTPRTISPQEPFYSVFTILKPTHRRTQHTRVNLFEQRLPHKTQNSLVICVLPKYTEISTPPQRQLRFAKFRGTLNTVAGYITILQYVGRPFLS